MSSANAHTLDLIRLIEGIPAITPSVGAMIREACMVCFDDQSHKSGVELKVIGDFDEVFTIIWQGDVTEDIRRAWRYKDRAIEYGACGIAILLIEQLTGYTVIEQAMKGDGFDYWLGHRVEAMNEPLKYAARLEVSGMLQENISRIETRVREKVKQTAVSAGEYPAYVVVVEFGRPQAKVVKP